MTEAGKQWILDKTPEQPHGHFNAVEHWIRAFCEEVELREHQHTVERSHGMPRQGDAFSELKRELLGE